MWLQAQGHPSIAENPWVTMSMETREECTRWALEAHKAQGDQMSMTSSNQSQEKIEMSQRTMLRIKMLFTA